MSAENFKNRAEGWFALAKIAALMVAAGWTYYQWDKTIFPKEDHQRLIRAAQTRTDLQVTDASLKVGALGTAPSKVIEDAAIERLSSDEAEPPMGQAVLLPSGAMFSFTLENAGPFPVEMTIAEAQFAEARAGDASSLAFEWSAPVKLDIATVFGAEVATPRIVETKGKAELSGLYLAMADWCCADAPRPEIRLAEVLVKIDLRGIDPTDSTAIAGAEKTKTVRLRAFFGSDQVLAGSARLANASMIRTIASVPDNGRMPSYFDYLNQGQMLEVPG